jgi:thioesterase domain-containing protein
MTAATTLRKPELTESQRALLEKRLQEARKAAARRNEPATDGQAEPAAPAMGNVPAPESTSIIEIQTGGDAPPLYLVHGVGGGMLWGYSNLARYMGRDYSVSVFKSRGLDGLEEWQTIEEMAAHYVTDLRAAQPRGPYRLGGYCFGGIVALEMARQLLEQGEETSLLALINCMPSNTDYEDKRIRWSFLWAARFGANLARWLGCVLFRWSAQKRRDFVLWKLRMLRRNLARLFGRETGENAEDVVDLAAYTEGQRRLWEAHIKALLRYQPRPYAGRVTLFRTPGHPLRCSFDPRYGWGELAAEVTMKIMPGEHATILEEPHVRALALEIRRCLDEQKGSNK